MIALKSDTLCPFYAVDAVVGSDCSQRQHHPPVDTPTSMGGVCYQAVVFRVQRPLMVRKAEFFQVS